MTEAYLTGGDAYQDFTMQNQCAQSIMPLERHRLHHVDVDIRIDQILVGPRLTIHTKEADGFPSLWPISQTIGFQPSHLGKVGFYRIRFELKPVWLEALYTYFIMLRTSEVDPTSSYAWEYDSGDSKYPRGHRYFRTSGLVPWEEFLDQDYMFAEIGDPHSPPPPPSPPMENWIITDITYATSLDGLVIKVATNVPCHMYMYWTREPPQKHTVPRLRRGLHFSDTLRHCFVAWEENEQIEPGDTLLHTFIKPNWPVCETRWFVFRATIQGVWSTSISPIFEKHRTEVIVPLTFGPVIAYQNNRTVTGYNIYWAPCHDAPLGNVEVWHADPSYYLSTRTGRPVNYTIHRSFLTFDTSGIPPGSSIVGAALSTFLLLYRHNYDPNYPDMCITQGVQHDPVVPADYGAQLPYTTIGGQRDIHEMILGQYNDIPFNADGLVWINPTGLTKLCIRQQMDIIDETYPTGLHWMRYHSAQKGDGYQPLLTVFYVPP